MRSADISISTNRNAKCIDLDEKGFKELVLNLLPEVENTLHFSIVPIQGGSNNKLYLINSKGEKYILKYYFRHKGDRRDRLNSERLFTSFAWNHDVRCIAEPIVQDTNSSIGIYRYIEGCKLQPGEIKEDEVNQSLNFFIAVNRHKSDTDALSLPNASESCFSIEDHIDIVDYRIGRLKFIEVKSRIDKEAARFISENLVGSWRKIREKILSKTVFMGVSASEKIPSHDRVISPSDFGFHNAILGNDGIIRFIDFEYAGWDDPSKMVCDFFSQVAVPVPMSYFKKFSETVAGCVNNPDKTLERIKLLLPLHRIKWCCIILNHFLPVDKDRKMFAIQNALEQKNMQLEKAINVLNSVKLIEESEGV